MLVKEKSREILKIKQHKLVGSEQDLLNLLAYELNKAQQSSLAIMAGHFMLFFDENENCLKPGIIEENKGVMRERIEKRVGIFPLYTWKLAIKLGDKFHNKFDAVKLLILINDWQYVPTESFNASTLRKEFFDNFQQIPKCYHAAMQESQFFSNNDIIPSRKHSLAFPETWLKYRFQKSADKFIKQGKLEKNILNNTTNSTEVKFLDEYGNAKTLISCGITGCAGEITEMIAEVYKAHFRLLVIFAPAECYQPVHMGAEIALKLYNMPNMKVIIVDTGGSGEMSVQEIYNNVVNFSLYES